MSVELIHGDCLDILGRIPKVDTIITDPVWPNAPAESVPGWGNPYELFASAAKLFKARRLVVVLRSDSDPRFLNGLSKDWPFFRLQILPYVMPGYIGRKLGGDEIAYCFGEPVASAPGRRVIPGYAKKAQPNERPPNGHPMSRTLSHFRWLVNWWSEPEETILDPFMGSGTTGVACVEMRRSFIGIEIDEGYFIIAKKRIEEARLQITMPI